MAATCWLMVAMVTSPMLYLPEPGSKELLPSLTRWFFFDLVHFRDRYETLNRVPAGAGYMVAMWYKNMYWWLRCGYTGRKIKNPTTN